MDISSVVTVQLLMLIVGLFGYIMRSRAGTILGLAALAVSGTALVWLFLSAGAT